MGLVVPALTLATYPWLRALDSRAATELARIEPQILLLERLDIFAGATRASLERLARSAVEETVDAATVIIRQGDPADDFFVLTNGEVRVDAVNEGGKEVALGRLRPPDYFGEIGLLEQRPVPPR